MSSSPMLVDDDVDESGVRYHEVDDDDEDVSSLSPVSSDVEEDEEADLMDQDEDEEADEDEEEEEEEAGPVRPSRPLRRGQVQTTLDSFTTKGGVRKQSVSIRIKLTPKKLASIQQSVVGDEDTAAAARKRGRPRGNVALNEPKLKLFAKRGRPKGAKVQSTIAEPSEPEDLPWTLDDDLSNEQPSIDDPDDIECRPGIAFLVMFQARFYSVFQDIPQLGPQDFEIGLQQQPLALNLEKFMCRLLSLLLNRKKPVEPGRYKGALEELHSQLPSLGLMPYWPSHLRLKPSSPDAINDLNWKDRLGFLQMLGFWTLTNSEVIRSIINTSGIDGKGKIVDDDNNNPDGTPIASKVHYIGSNIDNIRFWLIKGQGDTPFRIYKQTNPRLRNVSWKPVAGTSQELEYLITTGELATDVSRQGAKLRDKLRKLVPEFLESEDRRSKEQKKEQRKQRQLELIESARKGEGEYVGRTRSRQKRVNYNIDDLGGEAYGDDEYYDSRSASVGAGTTSSNTRATRSARRSARITGEETTPISYDEFDEEEEEEVADKKVKEADAGDYEPSEDEEEDDYLEMDTDTDYRRVNEQPFRNPRHQKIKNGPPPGSTFVFPVVSQGFQGGYQAFPTSQFPGFPQGFPQGFPPGAFPGFPPGTFPGFPPGTIPAFPPGSIPGFPPGVPIPFPIPFPMGLIGPNGLPITRPMSLPTAPAPAPATALNEKPIKDEKEVVNAGLNNKDEKEMINNITPAIAGDANTENDTEERKIVDKTEVVDKTEIADKTKIETKITDKTNTVPATTTATTTTTTTTTT